MYESIYVFPKNSSAKHVGATEGASEFELSKKMSVGYFSSVGNGERGVLGSSTPSELDEVLYVCSLS